MVRKNLEGGTLIWGRGPKAKENEGHFKGAYQQGWASKKEGGKTENI